MYDKYINFYDKYYAVICENYSMHERNNAYIVTYHMMLRRIPNVFYCLYDCIMSAA